MEILRVNMTDQSIKSESMPDEYKFLGGRGLTSSIINNEVPAKSDALGPANKLVFAPGYLTATPLINTGRLSIGSKSPLTGGIKESNVGGTVAYALARIGIAAVIVEGRGFSTLISLNSNHRSGRPPLPSCREGWIGCCYGIQGTKGGDC